MPSRALAALRSSATRRMVSSSENSIGACHAFRADAAIRLWSRIYTFGQGCRTSYQVSALRATAPVAAPLGGPAAPCQTAKGQLPTGTAEAGRPRATYRPHRLQDYRPGLAVFGGYDGPRRRLTPFPGQPGFRFLPDRGRLARWSRVLGWYRLTVSHLEGPLSEAPGSRCMPRSLLLSWTGKIALRTA